MGMSVYLTVAIRIDATTKKLHPKKFLLNMNGSQQKSEVVTTQKTSLIMQNDESFTSTTEKTLLSQLILRWNTDDVSSIHAPTFEQVKATQV